MTPAATTPAARTRRPTSSPRPRRVSGPARPAGGGATRTAAAATARAIPAPGFTPPVRPARPARPARPRRVSGPARPAPRRKAAGRSETLGQRAVTFVRSLPDHSLLDRLLRGRVWVAVLGMMLVGIVAMQVEVLKLGASMGRNLQRTTALQATNESLRASVASLADDQRIEALAAKQGMVMPAPSDVSFLDASNPAALTRATSAIHAPSPSSFLSATTGSGAVVTTAPPASSATGLSGASPTASGATGVATVAGGLATTTSGATSGATSGTSSTIPATGSTSSTTP